MSTPESVTTIDRPEGRYSFAYGVHIRDENYEVPESIDGICLEQSPHDEGLKIYAGSNEGTIVQYATDKDIPIYATDCSINLAMAAGDLFLVPAIGAAASAYLASDTVGRFRQQEELTRRDFLRYGLKGATAAWLAMPLGLQLMQTAAFFADEAEKPMQTYHNVTSKLHPENHIIIQRMRNAVIAQKMHFLLKNSNNHLLATLGSAHTPIEEDVRKGEGKRLGFLNRLRRVLPVVLDQPETFYQINEYRLNEANQWVTTGVLEEPELKEILE